MIKDFTLIVLCLGQAFAQGYSTYTTTFLTLEVPSTWKFIKHSDSNLEFIETQNEVEITRYWAGIFPIRTEGGTLFDFTYYSPAKHADELTEWLQNQYQAKGQLLRVDKNYTSSFEGEVLLKNNEREVKANIRLQVLGNEVLTSIYVKNSEVDFKKDLILYEVYNSLKKSFYKRHGAYLQQEDYKLPISISNKELLGSWYYGNAHRVTFDSPGYHEDIILETTKAIDNSGINYTFFDTNHYQLTYRASSLSGMGKIEISALEVGTYKLNGQDIEFEPHKYVGTSSFNGDKKSFSVNTSIPKRKGTIQKIAPEKIKIREECAAFMGETWCNTGELFFVEFQRIKD